MWLPPVNSMLFQYVESETDSSQSDEPSYENTLGSTSESDSEAPEPGEIAPYSYEPSSSDSGSDSSVSEAEDSSSESDRLSGTSW